MEHNILYNILRLILLLQIQKYFRDNEQMFDELVYRCQHEHGYFKWKWIAILVDRYFGTPTIKKIHSETLQMEGLGWNHTYEGPHRNRPWVDEK